MLHDTVKATMQGFEAADLVVPAIWASHGLRTPDKPAIVCGDQMLTWSGFNAAMNRLANALIAAGVNKGDRVAVLVSSSIEACVAMFGTVKSGAIMVPVSSMLTSSQVQILLEDSEASFVIASSDLRGLIDSVVDQLPKLRGDGKIGTDFSDEGWISLDAFVADAPATDPAIQFKSGDPFSIMYSSGTTGLPKGVLHSHGARNYFCASNGFEMKFDHETRGLVSTALYTAGTWLVVMPTLYCGGTLHIHKQFKPSAYMQALHDEKITHTFCVPSQIQAIFDSCDFRQYDLTSLKMMLSAGSPLRLPQKEQLIDLIGPKFYELYGFTEGSSTLLRPEDQSGKASSVGYPLMGQTIKVVDDEGNLCRTGTSGEIVGYGPGLLTEYWKRPAETEKAIWRDADGRTFIRSGDVGRFDEEGFLYIVDRKKDMIISGGLNIYPTDLEAVVAGHEAVQDVSVIGVPHRKWGETPVAVVILKQQANRAGIEDEIVSWSNQTLGKHQRLSSAVLRSDLPRNALGKVLKRVLREEYSGLFEAQD